MHAPAQSRIALGEAATMANASPVALARTHYFLDATLQNWPAATADAKNYGDEVVADKSVSPRYLAAKESVLVAPLRAEALARSGDFKSAQTSIDATPRDCYHCVRVRGLINALQKNETGAAFWFADAVKQAPSLPFAYADWGQMLMNEGDLDGAIAKFTLANQRGPHFADPLEMWGEALVAKNRSDLALVKFAEAEKYAPNWGRLHLKWGEALAYLGKTGEAKAQFAISAGLDLSPVDRTILKTWMART
jgi:tetratricopeptide (TPR) repeat protein